MNIMSIKINIKMNKNINMSIMSTKINIKMNKNIEKSKNSIKKSNYNNIKLPTNQLKHLHNNNNLGN